jgi:hypothetical protein
MGPILAPKRRGREHEKHDNWRQRGQKRSRKPPENPKQHQTKAAGRPQNAQEKGPGEHKDKGHNQWTPSRCQNGPQKTTETAKVRASTVKNDTRNRQRHENYAKRPPGDPKTSKKDTQRKTKMRAISNGPHLGAKTVRKRRRKTQQWVPAPSKTQPVRKAQGSN